jgi:cellulose synthase (UDP-forming)
MSSIIWKGLAESRNPAVKLIRFFLLIAGMCWGALFVTLPLAWESQILLGGLTILGSVLIGRLSKSNLVTIALIVLSLFATMRYAWWRVGAVIAFFQDPSNRWDWVDAVCITVLLSAETYAFIILFLGFVQTISPLKRPPVPLPREENDWPHVDVLIPTYNEPLSVVRFTALASMNIDWPADKLHIYILDDGKREEFRTFAKDAGIGYVTRSDNAHAKAGNINRALEKLDSPYVAIFDCDHLPTRSFLQVTMGWFLREEELAMVQTPHHFYSADPFERNLKQFRTIPNEGELFYALVQDGNDFWNATFFCGSCAVLRRTALDEIGGIAVETVTEDAHTSLRMQMRGWSTAYINIPQAAGLATERLSGHIQQRVRWARGMIQILRTDNPLFAKGLKFAQRICYFNAMTHFLYALPRLIFLTAPLVYLFFGRSNVPGYWVAILAYALPHLVLSNVTNSRIQGQHRHSFWNEIYETVLAPYILLPTLTALINPKLGKFNVTAKGGFVEETYFDGKIAMPFVMLMLLNVAGLLMVIPRLAYVPGMGRFLDPTHPGTIAMNALWCLFNLVILGVAITVAREEIQRREQVRIDFAMPARMRLADGSIHSGRTEDISLGGTAVALPSPFPFVRGEWVTLLLPLRVGEAELPATIVAREGNTLRLQFEALSLFEEEMLTTILYSRADAWVNWGEAREVDRPLRSLYRILRLSLRGMSATFSMAFRRKDPPKGRVVASRVAPIVLCALMLSASCHPCSAEHVRRAAVQHSAGVSTYASEMSLRDLGVTDLIDLHGIDSFRTVSFLLPRDEIAEQAELHLVYRFSEEAAVSGQLKVSLNGTVFATLQLAGNNHRATLERVVPVPAELLVRTNALTFEFIGRQGAHCEEHNTELLWGQIDLSSTLTVRGQRLSLPASLQDLPLPFVDPQMMRPRVVPIVLASAPSPRAVQAAGVIASYFGMVAEYPAPRFPVTLGTLPRGDIVVIAEASDMSFANFDVGSVTTPLVSVRTNPNDFSGKMLIVTGADGDQVLLAAQAVAAGWTGLRGTTASAQDFVVPAMRQADDAPRWAQLEAKSPLWKKNEGASRESDGSGPLQIFLRVPPDLYAANKKSLNLHLDYRYTATGVRPGSTLLIQANGVAIASLALRPRKDLSGGRADVPLSVADVRPFSNSITAQWSVQRERQSNCDVVTPTAFTGTIEGSSYLDLHGLAHWAAMPNLELFSNAGFPFTRFADLSQTTVVLPAQPSAQEIEVFLTLLGHFGAQTGFPALGVAVGSPTDLRAGADRDFLLIGTGPEDSGIIKVNDQMPARIDGQTLVANTAQGLVETWRHRWRTFEERIVHLGQASEMASLPETAPEALIEGYESPYFAQRSIVTIELRDPAATDPFLTTFLGAVHSSEISGDVAVLEGQKFQAFRIGEASYAVGSRPWLTWLRVTMMQGPWFLVIGLMVFSLLSASRIQVRLREMSKIRLHMEEEQA